MDLANPLDITPQQQQMVLRLLQKHLPGATVWAYGSRVRGTARPHSDLDLVAFVGPQQRQAIFELKEAFEESDLPFRVDLFVWDELPESFHRAIAAAHRAIQQAAEN